MPGWRNRMPYSEALERGILVKTDKQGFNAYYPPCHICGGGVCSWSYSSDKVYTCNACKIIKKINHNPLAKKNA
jgi:hypothetical protein